MVAEFAIALPAVMLVFAALVSGVQLAATSVRLQDAAADAARALARGEPAGEVLAAAREQVPGVRLARSNSGGTVCAELSATPANAAGLLGIRLSARSCALAGGR